MRVTTVSARSLVVKSALPDADYVVNPYTGCSFGCHYCYASFSGRFAGENEMEWGEYVRVKANALDLVYPEVRRLLASGRGDKTIMISSVTDPYQPLEARYRLTQGILNALVELRWPGRISLLTKSPLVARDLDVIRRLVNPEVGITVTAADNALARRYEAKAPLVRSRLRILAAVVASDIPAYAFVGPLLPDVLRDPAALASIFGRLSTIGVNDVYIEELNTKSRLIRRISGQLTAADLAALKPAGYQALMAEALPTLDALVRRYGLRLRLGSVLRHG